MRLAAEDLSVRYPAAPGFTLERVTVAAEAGALTAVLGPNGSGKSTLLRALMGAVTPCAGRATVDGRDVRTWERRQLARVVGVVPQGESVAFPITVREMVGMGRYPHLGPLRKRGMPDHEAVRRALERCDVAGLADRPVTALSGGELQRVRIARALAQEPRALVLDEPTAGLDVAHEMTILGHLRAWARSGLTVLLVTHHLELAARFADRIVLLREGRVAGEGPPADVLREDVLTRVWAWPIRVEPGLGGGPPRLLPLDPPPER